MATVAKEAIGIRGHGAIDGLGGARLEGVTRAGSDTSEVCRVEGIQVLRVCTLTRMYPIGYIKCMDAVLHALSDGSRRTMLEMLLRGPATVGELAELLPIARPGVSRHLRVLREAGLVEVRHEAQWRVYYLRAEPLAEVDTWLGHYRDLWEQRLDALHTEVARGKHDRRRTT